MNLKSLLGTALCFVAFFCVSELFSQNLLNTNSWTVGTGGVTGFNVFGSANNNIRELGTNHNENEVVLWKAVPNLNSSWDGGWDSDNISIDNTKTYRLSVWIKKTNSDNGAAYFATNSITNGNQNLTKLNGSAAYPNPMFWNDKLPQLNRWYLLVGFVHNRFYTSTISEGKIYDGVTGQVVANTTDFKFNSNATVLTHRAYLAFDSNAYDRQYFWDPRIEIADGGEIPIDELLNISNNPKLLFSYDNAGNQKQRFYCAVQGCTIPDPPAGRAYVESTETTEEIAQIEELEEDDNEIKVMLSPNPTKGLILIRLNSNSNISLSHNVNVYNGAGIMVSAIPSGSKDELEIDLTNLSSGMYLVHIHISNGASITKQIIKN